MATQTVAGTAASAPAIIPTQVGEFFTKARADALDRASREILALTQAARAARKPRSGVDYPDELTDSVLRRVELLGTCVGVLADCRIDTDEIGTQYEIVFGRELEVSHA